MSAAAAAPDATSEAKPKSKKLLFILMGVVILALAGAGGAFFILKKNTTDHGDGTEEEASVEHAAPKPGTPPTFLPLDSMVVNLADPGGNRFVQLAITLQVQDAATSEAIKPYMPSIRNGILMLVSQRTAEVILKPEGKEKLSLDIIEEVSTTMGYELDDHEIEDTSKKKKRRRAPPNPVQGVLFSSFIVQ
ncbi:flagellar basal body-associated FliL family protein [Hydrogenophaga sp. PAMC20947]|uniref:flagellar basal body-associated FliL family protein n=1 Tax=Hydrogenophaga sp. PAMC20947 TaxID=2565558 RepID=UPI00109DC1D4|nr:flagellar basal body-associated FliL family protein [Hydrogenophaga sp. PAMC20947]QCB46827.1 flagellar basal body protein FliL [Hydrogenophaga sp. PAMC20947]